MKTKIHNSEAQLTKSFSVVIILKKIVFVLNNLTKFSLKMDNIILEAWNRILLKDWKSIVKIVKIPKQSRSRSEKIGVKNIMILFL